MRQPPSVTVLAMAGQHDVDLVPHFLKHYRDLGVAGFRFVLHGEFDPRRRDWMYAQPDITVFAELHGLFTESSKVQKIDWMLEGLEGTWAMMVDLDEFIELPQDSLAQTISAMEDLGLSSLPAFMVQRMTCDGQLAGLAAEDDIQQVFANYSFNLAERIGTKYPPIKTKYPLARVEAGARSSDGFHYPLLPDVCNNRPLRATLSHFKWRDRLKSAVKDFRGNDANSAEMATYGSYIGTSDVRLPTEGARPYGRADLIARGFLVPFNQGAYVRPAHTSNPLQICLATREISGPLGMGGVCTATVAMAEALAARGHQVQILYIPFEPSYSLAPFWQRGWRANGIDFAELPLKSRTGQRLSHGDLQTSICDHLAASSFDVAHFDDGHALGAKAVQLRASGLGLGKTAIGVTSHGCSRWHAGLGTMPPSDNLNLFNHSSEQQIRFADFVIHPSCYMQNWVAENMGQPRQELVVPNALPGHARCFGTAERGRSRIDEVVFFGRVEPRKGWTEFVQALELVRARGISVAKVTVLGKIGPSLDEERFRETLDGLAGSVHLIQNFPAVDAVNYLRAQDCFVVIPSKRDNLPYTVYECLENAIAMVCSDVGGILELVAPEDHDRVAVANNPDATAEAICLALTEGWIPASLAFDADKVPDQLAGAVEDLVAASRVPDRDAVQACSVAALCFATFRVETPNDQKAAFGGNNPSVTSFLPNIGTANRSFTSAIAAMNAAISDAVADYILLCNESLRSISPELIPAMSRLLSNKAIDAVVCDFHPRFQSDSGQMLGIGTTIEAPAGPVELSPCWNVFGAGIAMIRRSTLLRTGMLDGDCDRADTLVWEALNKICANGGVVTSLPRTMVTCVMTKGRVFDPRPDTQLHERLTRHWLTDLDEPRRTMASTLMYEKRKSCPNTTQMMQICLQAPASHRDAAND